MNFFRSWTAFAALVFALPFGQEFALSDSAPSSAKETTSVTGFDHPQFVGTFRWDGKYIEGSKGASLPDVSLMELIRENRTRPVEVPPWMNLDPTESVIEDKVYTRKPLRVRSRYANFIDHMVTAVYGRELALRRPSHLTTDSRKRLLICDAMIPAVHVLDGESSFRIQGGPKHRLQHPSGIAVDREDNIYVSDPVRRAILVYSPDGIFQRYLGLFRGEPIFDQPTSIAISREHSLLYVLDRGVNEVTIMTLEGRLIRRIGNWRDTSPISFDAPLQVAVGGSRLAVLDQGGARIREFDLRGELITDIKVRPRWAENLTPQVGIAMDRADFIFLVNAVPEHLLIFTSAGKLVYELDHEHGPQEALLGPEGVWVDDSGRLLIADTGHSRIEVFQLAKESVSHNAVLAGEGAAPHSD